MEQDGEQRYDHTVARAALELCGVVAPEAGHHKTRQLCVQAEQALAEALAGSRDEALRELMVVWVQSRRGGRLEVAVCPEEPGLYDPGWLAEKLDRARGYLRGEVAQAIHRKRTPDLCFVVLEPREEARLE